MCSVGAADTDISISFLPLLLSGGTQRFADLGGFGRIEGVQCEWSGVSRGGLSIEHRFSLFFLRASVSRCGSIFHRKVGSFFLSYFFIDLSWGQWPLPPGSNANPCGRKFATVVLRINEEG